MALVASGALLELATAAYATTAWVSISCTFSGLLSNCLADLHDHHCVWLNNCVGRRNYKFFFSFLLFTSISALYMTAVSIYYMVESWKMRNRISNTQQLHDVGVSFRESLKHTPVGMLLAILGFLGSLYPVLLCGLHVYLMITGQQTREFVSDLAEYFYFETNFWVDSRARHEKTETAGRRKVQAIQEPAV